METRMVCSIVLSCLLSGLSLQAQERPVSVKKIPPAVLGAFHRSYPSAKIRGASTEVEKGKKYYEIESLDGNQARDILYLSDGTAVEIEERVPADSLPAAVRESVAKVFPGAEITKAERLTKGDASSFEIHVQSGPKKGSVVTDTAGTVLEKHALSAPKKKPANRTEEEGEDD